MLDQCPLTNVERNAEIVSALEKEIGGILDNYFANSPFLVAQEQHYRDHLMAQEVHDNLEEWRDNHEFITKVRGDMGVVKTSFLRKLGGILALLLVGGISWRYIFKYFTTNG